MRSHRISVTQDMDANIHPELLQGVLADQNKTVFIDLGNAFDVVKKKPPFSSLPHHKYFLWEESHSAKYHRIIIDTVPEFLAALENIWVAAQKIGLEGAQLKEKIFVGQRTQGVVNFDKFYIGANENKISRLYDDLVAGTYHKGSDSKHYSAGFPRFLILKPTYHSAHIQEPKDQIVAGTAVEKTQTPKAVLLNKLYLRTPNNLDRVIKHSEIRHSPLTYVVAKPWVEKSATLDFKQRFEQAALGEGGEPVFANIGWTVFSYGQVLPTKCILEEPLQNL